METKVPAATVENESMLEATSEKPPVDQLPTYQVGLAKEWPAAAAAAATSSKTRAQRSARPKTMAKGRKRLNRSCGLLAPDLVGLGGRDVLLEAAGLGEDRRPRGGARRHPLAEHADQQARHDPAGDEQPRRVEREAGVLVDRRQRAGAEEGEQHRPGEHEGAEPDPAGPLPLGAAAEPPALHDLVVHEPLDGIQRRLEVVLQLRQGDAVAARRRSSRGAAARTGARAAAVAGGAVRVSTQSSARKTPWSSRAICRWPRTARSTSVEVMSTRLTSSSRIVPTMPGCTPARRGELHGDGGAGAADDDRHLLVDAGGQARGQAGVLLVAAAAPHEQPHQGPGEQRAGARRGRS